MYADQLEAEGNRSIKDRLNGNSSVASVRRNPSTGKRQREDSDKWEHDMFKDNGPQLSNHRIGSKDLRLKLQRKSMGEATQQSVRRSISGGVRDLREKLSGISYSALESKPPLQRRRLTDETSKPPRKNVVAQAPVSGRKIAASVPKKKVESVDNFLRSLDLEKYSITFQAEEIDMVALVHMGDGDLKALGIPMGPRKKILLALESKSNG